MDAPIQHVAEQVDHVCSHAGMSGRERIRAEEQDRAHHIFGKGGAHAHSVASHEVTLQSAQIPVRHAHRRKIAETGVHAVDGIVTLGDLRDHLGRLLYLTLECTSALCPIVTSGPTNVGSPSSVWMVELSWTFVRSPITIRSISPRRTVPNHTDAPLCTVTSPMSTAVGATNASGATFGIFPR